MFTVGSLTNNYKCSVLRVVLYRIAANSFCKQYYKEGKGGGI